MLDIRCQDYYEKVCKEAEAAGTGDALRAALKDLERLANGRVCKLFSDRAPRSFYFHMMAKDGETIAYDGGVIFYAGSESGAGAPQFSVSLDTSGKSRWEIHT